MYLESGQNLEGGERIALCELLDRVLNKGVVVSGQVTISVAEVDLIYLGLQVVLTSMETARESLCPREEKTSGFSGSCSGGV